jgi:hypothetical protein
MAKSLTGVFFFAYADLAIYITLVKQPYRFPLLSQYLI